MKSANRFLFTSLTLAMSGVAFGQADECVNATDLGTGPATAPFDTNFAVDTMAPATTSPGSACFLSDDVWFKYTASADGTATFSTCGSALDTEIGVYEGSDCSTFTNLGCNDDSCGLQSEVTVPVTMGNVYHVQIGHWNTTSGTYGAGMVTITETPSGGGPTNDTCLSPDTATVGTITYDNTMATSSGFNGGGSCSTGANSNNQDLFYTFTPADGGTYQIDTQGSTFDTKLSVHDGSDCMATCLAYDDDGGSGLQSLITLELNAGQTVLIQAGAFSSNSGMGMLNIAQTGTFCDTPDGLESNTDCATAAPLVDGTYTGLNVSDADQDYYAVTLADGATLDASILFLNANADIDLYLWDPAVGCDTNVVGTGGPWLVRGFSATDDETISYTNMTGATQCLIMEVDVFSTGDCNRYDLVLSGTGDGGVGAKYCLANPNSTGVPASLSGSGSADLIANDLVLTTTDLPANAFGFVIASLDRGFVPLAGMGAGNLCLGGDIGRGVGGQIYNSGATGTITANVDWTALPTPTGTVAAISGDTWNFQTWSRDSVMGIATSNLSNGLAVTVQ
ncbi:hypothetical protein Poly30_35060 [Planctomycetes bacterium Poly30]|uniref:T9SS-like galactose binding domain-containing protein n=1 Tax=Saltatorellus ferox TaxID=2528018 RepID=A0A518EV55_9BACT|nr:hypothetical protein Poly30_35060 [Planctomycetes bacterium Poly30]